MFEPINKTKYDGVYFQYENALMCVDNIKHINSIDILNNDYILNFDYDALPLNTTGYRYFTKERHSKKVKGSNILLAKELLSDDVIIYMYNSLGFDDQLFIFYENQLSEKDKMIINLYGKNFE